MAYFRPLYKALILAILLGLSTSSLAELGDKVMISELAIEWDSDATEFGVYFKVENRSDEKKELTAIVELKYGKDKRWRGAILPTISAGSDQFYKARLPVGIMLKNDYHSISMKVYGKEYRGILDSSARFRQIQSRRLKEEGETRIELEETEMLDGVDKSKPNIKVFVIGSEKEFSDLLAKGSYDNIILETITTEGETIVLTKSAPKKKPKLQPMPEADPKSPPKTGPKIDDLAELLAAVDLDEMAEIEPVDELKVVVADVYRRRREGLKLAKGLEILDISSREKLISLYLAEGKSEILLSGLAKRLASEPENLKVSLMLSSVYLQQGNIKKALKVLNASLARSSLSARVALIGTLKTKVKKGESTLAEKSDMEFLADEFFNLGLILLKKKKYLDAITVFQSVGSIIPDYPLLGYYVGKSRHGAKQFNQAIRLFKDQSDLESARTQRTAVLTDLSGSLAIRLDVEGIQSALDICAKAIQEKSTSQEKYQIRKRMAALNQLMIKARQKQESERSDLEIRFTKESRYKDIEPGYAVNFHFEITNLGKKQSSGYTVYYKIKHEQGMIFDISGSDTYPPPGSQWRFPFLE